MKWITETIAVGGLEDILDLKQLRTAGITGVLSIDWFPASSPSKELLWRKHVLVDGPGNSPSDLDAALSHVRFLVDNCPRVLVACREGLSRSPFLAACHIATLEHRKLADVINDILGHHQIAIDPALLELWDHFSAELVIQSE